MFWLITSKHKCVWIWMSVWLSFWLLVQMSQGSQLCKYSIYFLVWKKLYIAYFKRSHISFSNHRVWERRKGYRFNQIQNSVDFPFSFSPWRSFVQVISGIQIAFNQSCFNWLLMFHRFKRWYINQFQSPGNSGGSHFTKRVMKWSKCCPWCCCLKWTAKSWKIHQ